MEFCGGVAVRFGASPFLLNLLGLSLSPLSLNDALFIEPCLRRPKFDKETLKGSQPHLLQT